MRIRKYLWLILALCIVLSLTCESVFAAKGYNVNSIDNYVGQRIIDLNYYFAQGGYYPYVRRLDSQGNLQCVGLAYARLEEKLGLNPGFCSGPGAKDIPDNAPNGATITAMDGTKYTIEVYRNDNGSHFTANSWASFGPGHSSYGHVIYIEEVFGDTVYYTESGTSMWKNGTAGVLKKTTRSYLMNNGSSGGRYIGTVVFRPQTASGSSNATAQVQRETPWLQISMTSYPTSINQGSSFGLRGTVSSNYAISEVRGYIYNANGQQVMSTVDNPYTTSMNVRYANLNNNLLFGNLGAGNYTLKVVATGSNISREWSCSFTVVGANNSRAGTINIPSGWTSLTLRNGPGTNYRAIAQMPQGARVTVYPDKTVNGWYYVNYNDTYGYASGRQISLQ